MVYAGTIHVFENNGPVLPGFYPIMWRIEDLNWPVSTEIDKTAVDPCTNSAPEQDRVQPAFIILEYIMTRHESFGVKSTIWALTLIPIGTPSAWHLVQTGHSTAEVAAHLCLGFERLG
jgi:hypothetical protein